jgi:hypothetical protein
MILLPEKEKLIDNNGSFKSFICYFAVAAITSYQQKLITLQFWTAEVQDGSQWAKIKHSAKLHSFWRLCGRVCFLTF